MAQLNSLAKTWGALADVADSDGPASTAHYTRSYIITVLGTSTRFQEYKAPASSLAQVDGLLPAEPDDPEPTTDNLPIHRPSSREADLLLTAVLDPPFVSGARPEQGYFRRKGVDSDYDNTDKVSEEGVELEEFPTDSTHSCSVITASGIHKDVDSLNNN